MTLWTNSSDRRSDRRYDPTGHLMTVKTTIDSTGGPIVRLIPKSNSATYVGSILELLVVYNVNSYQTIHFII